MNIKRISDEFENNGIVKLLFCTESEVEVIHKFSLGWLSSVLDFHMSSENISNYHTWFKQKKIEHDIKLKAKNRHIIPPENIKSIFKTNLLDLVREIFSNKNFNFWDEGLGWLAFRLIRPNYNDGYPPSKKSWGPAKNVFSVYIPIIQTEQYESIGIIPGSHKKKYNSILEKDNKFCADELRVDLTKHELTFERYNLKKNECLLFSPEIIHTESVDQNARFTRFSLEIRFYEKK